MAEPVVHIGENSPEQVAFKLLELIGLAEKKKLGNYEQAADREWLLQTYAQCLRVVREGWTGKDAIQHAPTA